VRARSKPALAGLPVANGVRDARRKLRDISFLPKALECQIVCEFRNRYREFESTSLHHSVRHFSQFSENRSQSARVRAICDHVWFLAFLDALGSAIKLMCGPPLERKSERSHDTHIARFAPYSQSCGRSDLNTSYRPILPTRSDSEEAVALCWVFLHSGRSRLC